ncbi:NAD/NADP octopine/nopaline dehydrogenase family protein [Ralstonia solanacearum]|uniref:Dehydrogenase n=1 Tax=Ralstonia solanacearum K60 TaxID=1091042 RepID=A0AAP7ZRG9_RALSL|nr:NAD/NADP-dependent octopine/nopaline dehydrogenase family protein [Ralstonia solanacearum]MBT1537330.1 NAD/NADP octopine/nopaline dehydrogenase family protein [Ralstonia solanacearum]OYQ15031.1 dehydrogenase [Ralstonia solanacearum K60]QOK83052.1 NAD(P)-binding domain-containing protein [Ralstonia solanacearum]RIJ87656.1 dehydrogenase [Ralstonia solanacearum]CCF96994.1 putative dehydrogenase [Ralstonia solanacearum K60]
MTPLPFPVHARGRPFRVCICGGGSLAHALAAVLGAQSSNEVRLLTRQPARWSRTIRLIYLDKGELCGRLHAVSDDPAEVVVDADLVILAVPHAAREAVLRRIACWLGARTWLAGFPGFGGLVWAIRRVLGDQPVMGLQRVPYVRKVISYGQVVWVSGIRPELFVATVPSGYAPMAARLLQALLNVPAKPLAHYLGVCLSNSNPIFHPSRLYALWRDAGRDLVWTHRPEFYEDWDDLASETYLACERDLQAIGAACPVDLSARQTLLEHYRATNAREVTRIIRGIAALRDRPVPMRAAGTGWTPDLYSYYFTEDIPYGIVIQRALADIVNVPTPALDAVISWAQRWTGMDWLNGGKVCGRDALDLPLPQWLGVADGRALVEMLM